MTKLVFPSIDQKFNTVISKNTFYFYNEEFEEYHEGHISSIAQNIFLLKNRIEQEGLKESVLKHKLYEIRLGGLIKDLKADEEYYNKRVGEICYMVINKKRSWK
ncbi:MAG: hypothetical protein ACUVQP_11765 [Bacteroidales bacterium]